MKDHIHTVGDGRGLRQVTLNGEIVRHCVYVDTRRGVVISHRHPISVDRRLGCVRTIRRKGRVSVEFTGAPPHEPA